MKKKLHFPSWPGFGSEKSIRLGYTRFFFPFYILHVSQLQQILTQNPLLIGLFKHSEFGQMALNFELIVIVIVILILT